MEMNDHDSRETRFDDDSTIENSLNDSGSVAYETPVQIGQYRILGLLGEGGFGVVYEAQQEEPVKRRVALKVIKPGMDSKKVIARFEAERQALAMMNHPNISKVLGGGLTERGLPYFVMELVKGEPITKFCDRNKMTLDGRLRLLIPVCQAIQHAHSKSVIHRDIKPTNILVGYDNEGHAHATVIDFGVAKALNQQLTEKTIYTTEGQMIGTPEYMSPEQAEMSSVDIDTRTDVYSLGVVLYELLTGMLPFEPQELRSKMYAEMQRMIREQEPPRPSNRLHSALSHMSDRDSAVEAAKKRHMGESELPKHLRGELDWVVMKCLEKNRDRRYPTPIALADEILHYLNNEPVLARPPSATYRLNKLVTRHKLPVAVSVGFITLLVAATLISTQLTIIAGNERKRAFLALAERDIALTKSQAALTLAEGRLSQIQSLVRVYSDYEQQIRRIEGATSARDQLATATMDILDQLGSELNSEPWIDEELASGYLTIGQISSVQNQDYLEIIKAYSRAKELFGNLKISEPSNIKFVLGEAQATIGLSSAMMGHEDSLDSISHAVQGELLAKSVNAQGEQLQLRNRLIARSLLVQANHHLLAQNFTKADVFVQRVLQSDIASAASAASSTKALEIRANALRILARVNREQGITNQALGLYNSAIDLRRKAVKEHSNDAILRRGLIRDLYWLGRILAYDAKDPEQAATIYRESLAHAEHLRAADPLDGLAYELVLDQRKALASALRRAGQIDQALRESDLLMTAAKDYASIDPLDKLRQRRVVAVQFDQARALYKDAMRTSRDPEMIDEAIGLLNQSSALFSDCSSFYTDLILNNPLGSYDKFKIDAADIEIQHGQTTEKLGLLQDNPGIRQSAIENYLRAVDWYNSHQAGAQLADDQTKSLSIAYRNIGTISLSIPDGAQAVKYLELADETRKLDHWTAYARKAEAYRLIGNEPKCRAYADQAFESILALSEEAQSTARPRIQEILDQLDTP